MVNIDLENKVSKIRENIGSNAACLKIGLFIVFPPPVLKKFLLDIGKYIFTVKICSRK